ncbi:MAG: glycosyltransferase family 4 protein [Bacillota bacterium]
MELLSVGPPGLDSSGYGEMQRRILLALEDVGWNVTMRPFASLNALIEDDPGKYRLDKMRKKPLPPPGSPLLFFGPAVLFYPNPNYYNIGFTMTEFDRISKEWADKCNSMDEVWVPSRFNFEIFISAGVLPEKIHIMPLGVDTRHFFPPKDRKDKEKFSFLSSFELIQRKGCDLLIEAFCQEFCAGEPAELVIKAFENWGKYDPSGKTLTELLHNIQKKYPKAAAISLKKELILYSEVPSLYQDADCCISASRGEGWNLPAMEAMACGIPVIAYNWSGHTEFLNHDNSFLMEIPGLEEIKNGVPTGARWVKADTDSLRKMMRYVFENPSEAIQKGEKSRENIAEKYSIENIARMITSRIKNRNGAYV